jgi:hypothetical protein
MLTITEISRTAARKQPITKKGKKHVVIFLRSFFLPFPSCSVVSTSFLAVELLLYWQKRGVDFEQRH